MRVRMRERKRALYHSATVDVRESAKKNDDGATERELLRRARDDDALVSLSLICVNRVIRLPSTSGTSA